MTGGRQAAVCQKRKEKEEEKKRVDSPQFNPNLFHIFSGTKIVGGSS